MCLSCMDSTCFTLTPAFSKCSLSPSPQLVQCRPHPPFPWQRPRRPLSAAHSPQLSIRGPTSQKSTQVLWPPGHGLSLLPLSLSVLPSFLLFPTRVFGSLSLFPRSRSLDLSSFHSCQTHTSLPSRKLPLTQLNPACWRAGCFPTQTATSNVNTMFYYTCLFIQGHHH